MKISVFGATGNAGSRIVTEAVARGHEVTAIIRKVAQASLFSDGIVTKTGEASNAHDIAQLVKGADLVISAVRPPSGQEDLLVSASKAILDASKSEDIRVILVGGAASLNLPGTSNLTVLTAPGFLPASVVPIARACQGQYDLCLHEDEANWTYVSPPALFRPGIRTGSYRLGADELLVDDNGNSAISMEDFAIAVLDEAETPKHEKARFTVAN